MTVTLEPRPGQPGASTRARPLAPGLLETLVCD
jgi:hypothetical protein